MIWHKQLPFKISFFLWIDLRVKLPTNEKITSFGKDAADCYCCHRPGNDEINYMLVNRKFAKYICHKHSALVGTQYNCNDLRSLLMKW